MSARERVHARRGGDARSRSSVPRREAGQSIAEYLVGCAVVVALVTVPVGGESSALALFLASVKTGFANFAAAIAVP
jgi:hypothetical protein